MISRFLSLFPLFRSLQERLDERISVYQALYRDFELVKKERDEQTRLANEFIVYEGRAKERIDVLLKENEQIRIEAQIMDDRNRRLEADVQEWKAQFFAQVGKKDEARDAHQKALELVIDWESQRLMGRQIFHHAPLLQPTAPPLNHHVPLGGPASAREKVRQMEAKFNEEDREQRLKFFNGLVKEHQGMTSEPRSDNGTVT